MQRREAKDKTSSDESGDHHAVEVMWSLGGHMDRSVLKLAGPDDRFRV